jgi:hypothetical protein
MAVAGLAGPNTYQHHFGSIEAARAAAGLEHAPYFQHSREELIAHLQLVGAQLGRTPSHSDIAAAAPPWSRTYHLAFVGLQEAQRAAGFEPNPAPCDLYSDEDLLALLVHVAEVTGEVPTLSVLKSFDGPTPSIYTRRFDSLEEARRLAGICAKVKPRVKHTDESLISRLQEMARRLGRTPTVHEIEAAGPPHARLYSRRFGSIPAAQEAAGLKPNRRHVSISRNSPASPEPGT